MSIRASDSSVLVLVLVVILIMGNTGSLLDVVTYLETPLLQTETRSVHRTIELSLHAQI